MIRERLAVALLVALVAVGAAQAQVASATLTGAVVDESSAVAPGVTIVAREESTGFTRTTVTEPKETTRSKSCRQAGTR